METKYAWWMRNSGVTDADVVINNAKGPCVGPFSCRNVMPAILPPNSTVRVWWPGPDGPQTKLWKGGVWE